MRSRRRDSRREGHTTPSLPSPAVATYLCSEVSGGLFLLLLDNGHARGVARWRVGALEVEGDVLFLLLLLLEVGEHIARIFGGRVLSSRFER